MRVNVNEVTHIFYHSLVVDPQKAFYQDNAQTAGFCEWMTTVDAVSYTHLKKLAAASNPFFVKADTP